jgi:tyrosyl-tRNA synthetase
MEKTEVTETKSDARPTIPQEILAEAQELARGTEVLPEGVPALALKILEARKANRPLRVKFGVDPTSADLHLGHAVGFRRLKLFQDFGHQIVVIIGGFTAQIGDPSGRNATRPALTAEEVAACAKTYLDQMGVIIDLEKAEVTNNADWLSPLTLADVIKLAGSVTINQLMAKEAFGERFEKQLPVGFHELFYPILQGYDSVAVRSDVELGGTDQRFNILQGRALQPLYKQEPQLAMLWTILEGTDGVQKMSKSLNNYIGLKENPDDMFGKCMRIPDHLIVKYYELGTTLAVAEIESVKKDLSGGVNPKLAKEKLGKQVVEQYHGASAAKAAYDKWEQVHSQRQVPDDMPLHAVSQPTALFRLLVDAKLAAGTGEAKRFIQEGAVKVDGQPELNPNVEISISDGQSKVVQVGRRKFVRISKS